MCQRVWAQGGMKSWPFLQPLTLAPLLASSSLGTEAWIFLSACLWDGCVAQLWCLLSVPRENV